MKRFLLLAFLAAPAFAQSIAATSRGIVVAHHDRIQLFNNAGSAVVWTTDGVAIPASIVTGDERVAVLDALSSDVRIVELASGRGTTMKCGETPVGGVFLRRALYLLERDARALERIGADGARASIELAADPAFLRESNGLLYVYSRAAGVLQEKGAGAVGVLRVPGSKACLSEERRLLVAEIRADRDARSERPARESPAVRFRRDGRRDPGQGRERNLEAVEELRVPGQRGERAEKRSRRVRRVRHVGSAARSAG